MPTPETSGRENRDPGIASANAPADSASPSSTPEAPIVPVTPAAGSPVALTPTFAALPSQKAFEILPGPGEQPAPTALAPVPTGNIAAAAPSLPSPTTPVTAAGDAPVSAAASSSTAADSQVHAVPASGPQAGSTTPVLRTAKPEGALAPSSVERVAAAVKAQASLGGGRVKILLHPPHLGALRIEVVVRNSVVYARMETESQGARHSL
ncbi:MAG: flagellar hook-length control protein FliK, partial [Planctomycetes bacterium]|nr:flagellar hook-length control protein FliK [Planctomycetota bacterium]